MGPGGGVWVSGGPNGAYWKMNRTGNEYRAVAPGFYEQPGPAGTINLQTTLQATGPRSFIGTVRVWALFPRRAVPVARRTFVSYTSS